MLLKFSRFIFVLLLLVSSVQPVAAADATNSSLTVTPDTSVATAFLVAPGVLVTAYHAVRGRQRLYIGQERSSVFTAAEVIGFSEELDVALVRAAVKAPLLEIGHWDSFPTGAESCVIGFPKIGQLVSEKRITVGVFNGDQRFGGRDDWFQLSAEIHRGNSGSPVIGADGKVYGLISHKLDAQKAIERYGDFPQNVNFALKSSRLLEFLDIYKIKVKTAPFDRSLYLRPYEVFERNRQSIFLLLAASPAS